MIIVWPTYFDLNRSRNEGRRVPKRLAVPSPKIDEIARAAKQLGLEYEIDPEARYPRIPWKTSGMILIRKNIPKNQVLKEISKKLLDMRKSLK